MVAQNIPHIAHTMEYNTGTAGAAQLFVFKVWDQILNLFSKTKKLDMTI